MNVEAHMSARVEKWTSTGSVHSRHSKVSCLFFGQLELWNSLSPALSHSSEYRREGASTHTQCIVTPVLGLKQNLHHYRNHFYKICSHRSFLFTLRLLYAVKRVSYS